MNTLRIRPSTWKNGSLFIDFFIDGKNLKDTIKEYLPDKVELFSFEADYYIPLVSKIDQKIILFYGEENYKVTLKADFKKDKVLWSIKDNKNFLPSIEFSFDVDQYERSMFRLETIIKKSEDFTTCLFIDTEMLPQSATEYAYDREFIEIEKLSTNKSVEDLDIKAIKRIIENQDLPFDRDYVQESRGKDLRKWWWHLIEIRETTYPQELLPTHLREIYNNYKSIKDRIKKLDPVIKKLWIKWLTGKSYRGRVIFFKIKTDKNVYTIPLTENGEFAYVPEKKVPEKMLKIPFDNRIYVEDRDFTFNFGLKRVLNLADFFDYFENKCFSVAYRITENIFVDSNMIISFAMEYFNEKDVMNFLIEGLLDDLEEIEYPDSILEIAEYFFKTQDVFYTRVVKNNEHIPDFQSRKRVILIWEDDNDKSAIAVFSYQKEKIGYIRNSVSKYMITLFKKKLYLNGEILTVNNKSNEIYIKVYLF